MGSKILYVLTSRALDDALGLGEDRASCAECIDIHPSLVARLVRVDTRHSAGRVRKCLGQTLNSAKVHLESRRDDERIIFNRTARVRADGVARRVEGRDILGNERDVRRHERRERPTERRLLLQAGTDQSPVSRPRPEGFRSRLRWRGRKLDRTYHPGCTTEMCLGELSSDRRRLLLYRSHIPGSCGTRRHPRSRCLQLSEACQRFRTDCTVDWRRQVRRSLSVCIQLAMGE